MILEIKCRVEHIRQQYAFSTDLLADSADSITVTARIPGADQHVCQKEKELQLGWAILDVLLWTSCCRICQHSFSAFTLKHFRRTQFDDKSILPEFQLPELFRTGPTGLNLNGLSQTWVRLELQLPFVSREGPMSVSSPTHATTLHRQCSASQKPACPGLPVKPKVADYADCRSTILICWGQ